MYAVIKTGGKQYRVEKGDVISVEKLDLEAGDSVSFEEVLLISDGRNITVGKPSIKGASVEAEVVENGKGKKVIIFKYKSKKDYRKKQGHRQPYTKVEIKEIIKAAKKKQAEEEPVVAEAAVAEAAEAATE